MKMIWSPKSLPATVVAIVQIKKIKPTRIPISSFKIL
jgi:hypothetical protein